MEGGCWLASRLKHHLYSWADNGKNLMAKYCTLIIQQTKTAAGLYGKHNEILSDTQGPMGSKECLMSSGTGHTLCLAVNPFIWR